MDRAGMQGGEGYLGDARGVHARGEARDQPGVVARHLRAGAVVWGLDRGFTRAIYG